jgi:glycosyltransferase involved in cell wall biosynthesis
VSDDLVVLGQDPRFGGGGRALAAAFLDGARVLGHRPALVYRPHPGLDERPRLYSRIEALYQVRAARSLAIRARTSGSLWVVATTAANGAAAAWSGRPYNCWLATTIESEWSGRAPGLSPAHRTAAATSLPVLRRLERQVLTRAQRIFATSAASRDLLARAAARDPSEVAVLPVPIDTTAFSPENDETWLERAAATPLLVFVGRADDPRKNVPLLLEAFEQIHAKRPSARLTLIGQRPNGRLPDGVTATGVVDHLESLLREAALFVLASRQEGFGIAVAEALAAGVPVVSTPSGGPEELLRASGGGIVTSSHDAPELADRCLELLRSPDRLLRARHDGRAYVARHHSQAAFRELLATALAG